MKMKCKGNIVFSLFMISFFALIIILSLGYPEEARMVPLVVATPGIIMAIVQFFNEVRGGRPVREPVEPNVPNPEKAAPAAESEAPGLSLQEVKKREILMALWILIVLALILLFGFWVAIAVTLLLFTRLYGKEPWKISLGTMVTGWGIIYIIFSIVLKVPLFEGFLIRLMG